MATQDVSGDLLSDDGVSPSGDGGGYTPFEFIEFTNIPMKHEVSIAVERPVGDCYKVWESRINWMQWFDMIDEVGFHEEEPSYMSMYMWYRWATTPFLELYVTLDRTQEEVNKYILEEPVEGFPLVAAVLFTEGDDGGSGGRGASTIVTLRVSYLLPKVLYEFAGQLAVYGDVNRKLEKCMEKMKSVVEAVDMQVLEEMKKENEEEIKAGFVEQRKRKERKGVGVRPEASLKDMSETVASEVEDVLLEEESVEEKGKQAVRGGRKSNGELRRNPGSQSM